MGNPVAGNQWFTNVADTIVSPSTINPILSDLNVVTGNSFNPITAAATLTTNQLQIAKQHGLMVSSTGAPFTLTVGGADTPAVAAVLQTTLGLKNAGDQTLLRFYETINDVFMDVTLSNGAATSTNVRLFFHGGSVGASQVLYNATPATAGAGVASPFALVVATANNVTPGSEVIHLDIVIQTRPSA